MAESTVLDSVRQEPHRSNTRYRSTKSPSAGPTKARAGRRPQRPITPQHPPRLRPERRPEPSVAPKATRARTIRRPAARQEYPIGLFFLLALGVITAAYQWRAVTGITAETGVGYALGLGSLACIFGLLLYPLRKRLRWLKALGPVSRWFQIHMTLGVCAATLAVLHSNFSLGSSNSRFAFGAVLLVAGSGLIGRYLYRKARSNLSVHQAEIRTLRNRLKHDRPRRKTKLQFLRLLQERLDRFDAKTLEISRDVWESFRQRWSLQTRIAREHGALMRFAARQLRREARGNPTLQRHQLHLHHALEGYLNAHMLQVEKLARLLFWERLFRIWHLVHLPVFALLVVSVAVHVAAVHLY